MKDFNGEIQYKDKTYEMVFNLNVMEAIPIIDGDIRISVFSKST